MRKKIYRKIMCLAGFIIMAVAAAYLTRSARALKWHGQYLTVNKAEGYNYIKIRLDKWRKGWRMKKKLALFSLMMGLICLGACVQEINLPKVDIPASAGTPSQPDERTSGGWDIRITGAEKTVFGMQEALSLPVSELELSAEVYRGVALTTLLEDVGAENVDRLAVAGKDKQRIVFAGNDINSRILLCWSKNYKPLSSLTLVARIWGETYILPDVRSIRIVRRDPETTQPNG